MDPERTKLTAPERIYLGYTSFWYETNEEGLHDIEYVRADLVTSPSDAEQLSELRRAGAHVLRVLETYKERHLVPAYLLNAMADLRDALAGVDRAVTVQCADCLTWFDKNVNHTCRQQVRRNQRSLR